MLEALLVMALGSVILGGALGFAAVKFRVEGDPLVEKIDAILPQTQCGQCGFPGCKPYAEAIAKGEADINCCPRTGTGEPRPKTTINPTHTAGPHRIMSRTSCSA